MKIPLSLSLLQSTSVGYKHQDNPFGLVSPLPQGTWKESEQLILHCIPTLG